MGKQILLTLQYNYSGSSHNYNWRQRLRSQWHHGSSKIWYHCWKTKRKVPKIEVASMATVEKESSIQEEKPLTRKRQEQMFNHVKNESSNSIMWKWEQGLNYVREWSKMRHNKERGCYRRGKCREVCDLRKTHNKNRER